MYTRSALVALVLGTTCFVAALMAVSVDRSSGAGVSVDPIFWLVGACIFTISSVWLSSNEGFGQVGHR